MISQSVLICIRMIPCVVWTCVDVMWSDPSPIPSLAAGGSTFAGADGAKEPVAFAARFHNLLIFGSNFVDRLTLFDLRSFVSDGIGMVWDGFWNPGRFGVQALQSHQSLFLTLF